MQYGKCHIVISQVLIVKHWNVLSSKYTMSLPLLLETIFVLLSIMTASLFLTRLLSVNKIDLYIFQDLSLFASIYESI